MNMQTRLSKLERQLPARDPQADAAKLVAALCDLVEAGRLAWDGHKLAPVDLSDAGMVGLVDILSPAPKRRRRGLQNRG